MTSISQKTAFIERIGSGQPLLLDGGLSNQLEALGQDINHPLWSALLLKENPEAIIQAHLDYLNAGSEVLISASYQATVEGFKRLGVSEAEAISLIIKSVELADQAIMRFKRQHQQTPALFIAASIGPYGAYLADGSEYTGDYGVTDEVLATFHRQRLKLLDETKADVLAVETIPSLQEAEVLSELLMSVQTPAWVTFACKDGHHLNDGTPIEKALSLFACHPNVVALGVNCTAPQYIDGLIAAVKSQAPNKAIIVYPNSGEDYDVITGCWSGICEPGDCAHAAKQWRALGALIIGGCCRMGPEHIKAIKHALTGK